MCDILSEERLINELNHFRYILTNYDFSEISNLIFFDIKSLNLYLLNNKDNPFERQYLEIETSLNKLSPYIPVDLSNDVLDTIIEIFSFNSNASEILKENLLFNLKFDFIEHVKNIRTEDEWLNLLNTCKKLRFEKMQENLS